MCNQRKEIICLLTFCCLLSCSQMQGAQPEVYLLWLSGKPGAVEVKSVKNISQHPGYDNQPMIDETNRRIVFVSGRDGNTELYAYSLIDESLSRLTYNTENEYSPLPVPGGKGYSVVKGPEQRLAVYTRDFLHDSTLLTHPDSVAYYQYTADGVAVLNVLDKERSVVCADKSAKGSFRHLLAHGGRTLKPYNMDMLVVQTDADSTKKNPVVLLTLSGTTRTIAFVPAGCEDFGMWENYLFYTNGTGIYCHNLGNGIHDADKGFDSKIAGIKKITRMVFSKDFKFAVVVATE